MPVVMGGNSEQSRTMLGYASFLTAAGATRLSSLCFTLMSREESFRGGRQAQPTAVKNKDGYQLKMDIEELNFNNQIITIQTSLLGFLAKDHYSFTHRLLR